MNENEIVEINEMSQEIINSTETATQETIQIVEPTMHEKLTDGMEIMGIGIGIVFLVLAIIYIIIKIMGKMAK